MNFNFFFNKKGAFGLPFNKVILLVLLGIVLIFVFLYSREAGGNISDNVKLVSIEADKKLCEFSESQCFVVKCEVGDECSEKERQKWVSYLAYLGDKDCSVDECDSLQKKVWGVKMGIYDEGGEDFGGVRSSLSVEQRSEIRRISEEKCKGKKGYDRLDDRSKEKLRAIAKEIGADEDALIRFIGFESVNTFCSCVYNPNTYAVGLIQFMPLTAKGLGTDSVSLCKMSEFEQLDYVLAHFNSVRGGKKLSSFQDLYMAILCPKAIGEGKDAVIFTGDGSGRGLCDVRGNPTIAYKQNHLDQDGDLEVTVAEAVDRAKLG